MDLCVCVQANRRIDGLYVYCAPPSLEELERRVRGRLREADSTIQRRLTWATEQCTLVSQAWGQGGGMGVDECVCRWLGRRSGLHAARVEGQDSS